MGYFRGTSNYPERILLYDLTQMISIADLVPIGMVTLMIDSRCSLEEEFTKLIRINLLMVVILNCQAS